jgi:hypothetical protein
MNDSKETAPLESSQKTAITSEKPAEASAQAVEVWKKYEDITMHFNDLIMRWRLQAMGGLATLVTVGGFVARDATTLAIGHKAALILSGMLACAWSGIAFIDLFYYRKLLKGAVSCILDFESKCPCIELSTKIEKDAKWGGNYAPWVFYSLGLLPLILIFGWSATQLRNSQPKHQDTTTRGATSSSVPLASSTSGKTGITK